MENNEPALNPLILYLKGWPIQQTTPVRLSIRTNHVGHFYSEVDFQVQFSLTHNEFNLWCCIANLNDKSAISFSYQHDASTDILEGEFRSVSDAIDREFETGYLRNFLVFNHNIEEIDN